MSESDADVGHDPTREYKLMTISIIGSSLSLIGTAAVVFFILTHKKIQRFNFKLIFTLIISCFMQCIIDLISHIQQNHKDPENYSCRIEAFLTTYFTLTNILATTAISHALIKYYFERQNYKRKSITAYMLYIFGIPFILAIIPLITGDYGGTNQWCWIKDDEDNIYVSKFLRYIDFYIPLSFGLIYNSQKSIKLILNYQYLIQANKEQDKNLKELLPHGIIMVCCWIFAVINKILYIFFDEEVTALIFLHVLCGNLQGFFSSFAFFLTENVKKLLKKKYNKIEYIESKIQSSCTPQQSNSQIDEYEQNIFGIDPQLKLETNRMLN